ncbi:hypothetical protein ACP70R_031636 [Stipagrostis hirtigluma subsp. patula]
MPSSSWGSSVDPDLLRHRATPPPRTCSRVPIRPRSRRAVASPPALLPRTTARRRRSPPAAPAAPRRPTQPPSLLPPNNTVSCPAMRRRRSPAACAAPSLPLPRHATPRRPPLLAALASPRRHEWTRSGDRWTRRRPQRRSPLCSWKSSSTALGVWLMPQPHHGVASSPLKAASSCASGL